MLNGNVNVPICSVEGCEQEAEYEIPAALCEEHWIQWFNYELEIEN